MEFHRICSGGTRGNIIITFFISLETLQLYHSFQIGSNLLLLLCGNLVGLYYQHMGGLARERTTARTRHFVESRVRVECEREHQEQLLLSVIPAYIAAEVKRNIMLRMADACQDGSAKSQRFQEMYVQRHNNVRL